MHDLRVIGVENGALVAAADDGERYRIPIDEVLQSKLRQTVPDQGSGRKLAPREIQAHIRAGMSAQDVASITGVPLEYIQRFEGPVLAEREYVVETALSVPVHTAADTDPFGSGLTFGTAIRNRLHDLGAINERWASWKEMASGWVVKLAFTAGQIDHDARWSFDPKKLSLVPLNNEAVQLSQQGDASGSLMPRLRAVAPADQERDESRFDSGAFELDEDEAQAPEAQQPAPAPFVRTAVAEEEPPAHSQTADLLEALRRRRGEREAASYDDDDPILDHPATGQMRLVELDEAPVPVPQRNTGPQNRVGRKGRVAMPSWDEIVFGARPDDEDDDLA